MRKRKLCPKHPDLTDKWNKEGKCKGCQKEWRRASDARNRDKRRAAMRAWRKRNAEAQRSKARAYWAKNRHIQKNANLRKRYFTLALFNERLKAQRYRCAVCKTDLRKLSPFYRHADHDHKKKLPRGILCYSCNIGLGSFKDDPKRLRQAANYLTRWRKV